jgi:hypothetical protein
MDLLVHRRSPIQIVCTINNDRRGRMLASSRRKDESNVGEASFSNNRTCSCGGWRALPLDMDGR